MNIKHESVMIFMCLLFCTKAFLLLFSSRFFGTKAFELLRGKHDPKRANTFHHDRHLVKTHTRRRSRFTNLNPIKWRGKIARQTRGNIHPALMMVNKEFLTLKLSRCRFFFCFCFFNFSGSQLQNLLDWFLSRIS